MLSADHIGFHLYEYVIYVITLLCYYVIMLLRYYSSMALLYYSRIKA